MNNTINTTNTANNATVVLHRAYEFVGPCALESGLMRASSVTLAWLNAHARFNAIYDGHSLVLIAIDNDEDMLVTSAIVAVESAGAWAKFTSRNSIINIWDFGLDAALKAAKPAYPVPKPEPETPRREKAILGAYESGRVAEKALEGYCIGEYNPVQGKPFGFIDSIHGDVFAYGLGDKPIKVVYDFIDTAKGPRVCEWRVATETDIALVNAAIENALAEKQAELDRRCVAWAEDRHRKAVEVWEQEKAFFEDRGFYATNVTRGSKNLYGRAEWEEYKFSRAIDKSEFAAYLKAMNINLVPETVEAPVCQGEIRLYRDGYRWATEGISKYWTRYESFVYYD